MRYWNFIVVLFMIAAGCYYGALAQGIRPKLKFTRLEANSKLSNPNVTAILHDTYGFLWVGTDDGLDRFDGYDFKVYSNIPDDSCTLAHNKIQTIFEDSHGTLWVSTLNSGLHYYDRKLDIFHRVPEFTNIHCQVMQMVEDKKGQLWLCGIFENQAFVASYDHLKKSWKKFQLMPSMVPFETILPISANEFWVGLGNNRGIFEWSPGSNQLKAIFESGAIAGNSIEKALQDFEGNIWIATRTGLSKVTSDKKVLNQRVLFDAENSAVNNLPVADLCIDGHKLWVAIENGGLVRIDISSNEVERFVNDRDDNNSIINNSIWSLHKDRQGRIWMGFFSAGLCVLDRQEQNFSIVDSFQNEMVNALFKDSKGRLWIATEDGLILQHNNKVIRFRNSAVDNSSLGSNAVLCIFEDHKQTIWVGLWNGGLNRFNESAMNFTRFNSPAAPKRGDITNPNVFSIGENSKTGELLVCTFGGLHILKNESRKEFDYIFDNPKESDVLLNCILEDSNKNIWVGAYSGLHVYDLDRKQIKRIRLNEDTVDADYRVNCIFEDSKGKIWAGSQNGLHQIGPTRATKTYTTSSGLPSNIVQSISEDKNGILWIGTTRGLSKFDQTNLSFRNYNKTDGLLSDNIRTQLRFPNGVFYVGGKGINAFNPDSLKDNRHLPEVFITELKIFNKEILPNDESGVLETSILETREISLNYSHTVFTLHYIGLDFTSTYKNQYAYKLENFDKDWNFVGTKREVTFTNLNPGTYTFLVKASNNDGFWNIEPRRLKIIVMPPWWATWWFRTVFVVMIISGAIGVYSFRVRNIKKQNQRLEKLVDERTRELTRVNSELSQSEKEIKMKNEELTAVQEELTSQRDKLEQQNRTLEENRKEIETKNEEISKQNERLEEEVTKRTAELLLNVQQIEQFAFMAAHNLRAPVARILGLSQLIDYTNDKEELNDLQKKIRSTVGELDIVVHDLNQVLEIKKNTIAVVTNVRFADEMELARSILREEIKATNATIIEDFSDVSELKTVKKYFESILINLLSNSLKYHHAERPLEIKVESRLTEEYICLIVQDNGIGFNVQQLKDKLFKFYSRFHTHVQGKGLGLYLVKIQTEALGGVVELFSNRDYGITVKVSFPKNA